MVKTTINLAPEVHAQAKEETAAARGISLNALIDLALRRELAPNPLSQRIRPPTYGRSGTRPSVDLDNSAALLDLMDEHQP